MRPINEFEFRRAIESDRGGISYLMDAVATRNGKLFPNLPNKVLSFVAFHKPTQRVAGLIELGKLREKEADMYFLVDPDHQGTGLGKVLFEQAKPSMKELKEQGIEKICAVTPIGDSGYAIQQLLHSLGFRRDFSQSTDDCIKSALRNYYVLDLYRLK